MEIGGVGASAFWQSVYSSRTSKVPQEVSQFEAPPTHMQAIKHAADPAEQVSKPNSPYPSLLSPGLPPTTGTSSSSGLPAERIVQASGSMYAINDFSHPDSFLDHIKQAKDYSQARSNLA